MLEVDALDEELQLAAIADTYTEPVPQRTRTLKNNDPVWHPYRHLFGFVYRTVPWGSGIMVRLMNREEEPLQGWYWQHNLVLCQKAGSMESWGTDVWAKAPYDPEQKLEQVQRGA